MEKKHKIPAVSNDTKGGKSAMSGMNPQKPDDMMAKHMRPIFENLPNHHKNVKEG